MVFFALCAQCVSTLVVMYRETNSWRWPVFTFVYMTALAYVGAEEWLVGALLANGFRWENTIITMHKMDYAVPEAGNPCLVVRPAAHADLKDILVIERAAFKPLWRNTVAMLVRYREQCPYFVVAESSGRVDWVEKRGGVRGKGVGKFGVVLDGGSNCQVWDSSAESGACPI